jgi:hypothetical protein
MEQNSWKSAEKGDIWVEFAQLSSKKDSQLRVVVEKSRYIQAWGHPTQIWPIDQFQWFMLLNKIFHGSKYQPAKKTNFTFSATFLKNSIV